MTLEKGHIPTRQTNSNMSENTHGIFQHVEKTMKHSNMLESLSLTLLTSLNLIK